MAAMEDIKNSYDLGVHPVFTDRRSIFRRFTNVLIFWGQALDFLYRSFLGLSMLHRRMKIFLQQLDFIGIHSLAIISFSACFVGAVMAFQSYTALHYFGADGFLGPFVGLSLARELAPVLTGIMVAGRSGAAIAAEISSMKISEQIDAMEALGTNPYDYLAAPRILAGTISLPMLYGYFLLIGVFSGYFIGVVILETDGSVYWGQMAWTVDVNDVVQGMIKSAIFGFVLCSVGCFYGFHASQDSRGVGVAANRAVVTSCLVILFSDYILTAFLPYDYSYLIL